MQRVQSWLLAEGIDKGDRWTVAELAERAPELESKVKIVKGTMGWPRLA